MASNRQSLKRKLEVDSKAEGASKRQKIEPSFLGKAKPAAPQFYTLKRFKSDGMEYLNNCAYDGFWGYLDYVYNNIFEYDFTYFDYYHGVTDFITFLIEDRKDRIEAGEIKSNVERKAFSEEAYILERTGIPVLEDTLMRLITDLLERSDDNEIQELQLALQEKSNPSCDDYIQAFQSVMKLKRSKVVYITNPDFIYGAEKARKICKIPGTEILTKLHQLGQLATEELTKNQELKNVNISVAHLSLVVTDIPHKKGGDHQRILVSMPLADENNNVASVANYIEHPDERKFSIAERADSAISILRNSHPDRTDIVENDAMSALLRNDKEFCKSFHHSEQAIAEFLKTDKFLDKIVGYLKSQGILPGHKVYAAVLDLYTTRDCCKHCGQAIIGMQNPSSQEFIARLNQKLIDEGYVVSDSTRTKIGIMKRGNHTVEKEPGIRMVVRAIHHSSYLYDKRIEEKARASQPVCSVSTDVRYINQKLFMTKPADIKHANPAAATAPLPLQQYTIFSSRKPDQSMRQAISNLAGQPARFFPHHPSPTIRGVAPVNHSRFEQKM